MHELVVGLWRSNSIIKGGRVADNGELAMGKPVFSPWVVPLLKGTELLMVRAADTRWAALRL